MKKFLTVFVVLFLLVVSVPLSADAQTCRTRRTYTSRTSKVRKNVRTNYRAVRTRNTYNNCNVCSNGTGGYAYKRPSFYRRHRNLVNMGVATGGGALIGALTGGKKGALIGTAVGAGSGALYTYVLNKKQRRYTRR